MTGRVFRVIVALYLGASLAVGMPVFAQVPAQQQTQAPSQASANSPQSSDSYPNLLERYNYTKGKRAFPGIFAPYTEQSIPQSNLANSPRIYDLIQNGKLQLSLQDAISLALANDLNIAVAEYTPWIDQTQLLNAEGGGTPLGAFVIGGGGGGSFDPVIAATTSISDSVVAANNALQGGSSSSSGSFLIVKSHSEQFNLSYSQEFHTGTTFNIALDNTRGSSSLQQDFFNPFVQSSLIIGVQQPLLNGFGFLPHTRFILEAKNTTQIGKLQFEEQVITEITSVSNQYWTLAADRQAVDVAKQTLGVAQKLYDDDQRQLQIGTLAHLDVVTAESEIASDNQALITAQTNQLQQETVVLNLITKDPTDSRLQGVEIIPTTTLEEVPQAPTVQLPDAVNEAWANRPELKVDQLTLNTDQVEVKATKNGLLPQLNLSAQYTSEGLGGASNGAFLPNGTFTADTTTPVVDSAGNAVINPATGLPTFIGFPNGTVGPAVPGGIGTTYSDIFHNKFPSYSATLNLSLPLRNRSAQATAANAQLTEREQQTIFQRDKNTIVVGVRQALTAVQQDAALVTADIKATQLAQETYDDEVKKFDLGASTTYNVVLQSRDLNAAKLNELTARTNLAIALVNFNQALGRTLTSNSITIAGNRQPIDNFTASAPRIPGTLGQRLAGTDVFGLGLNK
ncbi:MAG TPA: TolC family protein [Candidatus Acidoferrales bacterium]|nr:TolC family protein [Candidatus Acidoferrales bacterium]